MTALRKFLSVLAWLYFGIICIMTVVMYTMGDYWWPATLMLFGPRWIFGIPLILLIPAALLLNWRQLLPLGLALAVVLGPLLGYNIPSGSAEASNGRVIRVLSCNTMLANVDTDALVQIIRDYSVDVVALQEAMSLIELRLPHGWKRHRKGELVTYSRYPMSPSETALEYLSKDQWKRLPILVSILETPYGNVAFNNVHLPSPRYGLLEVVTPTSGIDPEKSGLLITETNGRLEASKQVLTVANASSLPIIVTGDLNLPRESSVYRSLWHNFDSAFEKTTFGYGWTFHNTYRGVPIPLALDHILTRGGAVPLTFFVGPEIRSDHRPIIADIEIMPSS